MEQRIMYRYLGTNGIIDSPVHLEGIYSIKSIILSASKGYLLTKNDKDFFHSVKVSNEEEIALWKEVKDKSI